MAWCPYAKVKPIHHNFDHGGMKAVQGLVIHITDGDKFGHLPTLGGIWGWFNKPGR
jgi:hypothetical protein